MTRPCHNLPAPGRCCYAECRKAAVSAVTHQRLDGVLVECLRCADHLAGDWISSRHLEPERSSR